MAVSENPIVIQADRIATVIQAIKIVLLTLTILASVIMVIFALATWSTVNVDMTTYNTSTETNSLAVSMLIYGIVGGVFWSLLIVAIGGWFELMLRTNAEKLRLAWAASPESNLEY